LADTPQALDMLVGVNPRHLIDGRGAGFDLIEMRKQPASLEQTPGSADERWTGHVRLRLPDAVDCHFRRHQGHPGVVLEISLVPYQTGLLPFHASRPLFSLSASRASPAFNLP
jgi:hypothetical protein